MIKEINYNDIFRSKLNRIEQDKECTSPLEGVRFVTKGFKQNNDVLNGSSLHGTYQSFNPDKIQRDNVFDKLYYNYEWQLWKMAGEPADVEVSYADSIILYEFDVLSELMHITQPGFLNKCYRIGYEPKAIDRVYPNNNIESVVKDLTKQWSYHNNYSLERFAKEKEGVDLNICTDDGIINLINQKYNRFCNNGLDNNIELVESMPEKVLAEAVKSNILDSELGEPLFFTSENKHITSISDRIRLHGTELDIFSMY